jgi:hypothetical protein
MKIEIGENLKSVLITLAICATIILYFMLLSHHA